MNSFNRCNYCKWMQKDKIDWDRVGLTICGILIIGLIGYVLSPGIKTPWA